MHDLLRRAVRERLQVVATYAGHPREFCPHVLGTWEGELRCLGLQFGGGSSSGAIAAASPAWRCFRVLGLSDLSARSGDWHTLPRADTQRCIDAIELEVAP